LFQKTSFDSIEFLLTSLATSLIIAVQEGAFSAAKGISLAGYQNEPFGRMFKFLKEEIN